MFLNNYVNEYGGGAVFQRNVGTELSGNFFCGNRADYIGGGILLTGGESLFIRNSILIQNHANEAGGAIASLGGYDRYHTPFEHLTLLENTAHMGAHLYMDGFFSLTHSVLAYGDYGSSVVVNSQHGTHGESGFNLWFSYLNDYEGPLYDLGGNHYGTPPDFVHYNLRERCTTQDLRNAPGGSLSDVGDGYTDPDGSITDLGAFGGPGSADIRWWEDRDGDGYIALVDCADWDPDVHPDTVWYYDADMDGLGDPSSAYVGCIAPWIFAVQNDLDCDDNHWRVRGPQVWYLDADGDGHGDPSHSIVACEPPEGYVADATDCNDDDGEAFPGQVWYIDADGDGFGTGSPIQQCERPTDGVTNHDDCDDSNVDIHPNTVWYQDLDGDSYGDASVSLVTCDPGEGWVFDDTDCDDQDSTVRAPTPHWPDLDGDGFGDASATSDLICPTAGMVENDLDCDDTNDVLTPNTVWYLDADGDGFGVVDVNIVQCEEAAGYVLVAGDCDDGLDTVFPGANEVCNGIDDDCDGLVDDEDDSLDTSTTTTFWWDHDGDGFGDLTQPVNACAMPTGAADNPDDCDDTESTTYPGAPEQCDDIDNNCNDIIDDGVVDLTWYLDTDGDGYGDAAHGTLLDCKQPEEGYVLLDGDCDENDSTIHPGAFETCDGVDQDCDGVIDNDPIDGLVYYEDADGDGYGNLLSPILACSQPAGYVTNNGDCDDTDQYSYPGAPELCDGLDNDCNNLVDDDPVDELEWYPDADEDGWGDDTVSPVLACEAPPGYARPGDCNDGDDSIHPDAAEICDGLDQNCNGEIDEGLPTETWYLDADGDGFGDPDDSVEQCDQPVGFVLDNTDCDDASASIHPGAVDIPDDGVDQDCDGVDATDSSNSDRRKDSPDEPDRFGCGCTTSPTPGAPAWAGLFLLAAVLRRRSR